ncbi:MAG: FlgO family outer membrane protein [Pseudomonadota bacterium]
MVNRYFIFISVILTLLFILFDTSCNAEFKKTKIAVLDFELKGDNFKTKDMGGIVAEWFTTSLVQDGRFQVVERAMLKKIIDEQKLGMSGLIDENSSSQLGKILGVKTIISGSVVQLNNAIEVNARIINVSTGSIVAAENLRSANTDNLKETIERLTAKIASNFPLTGYIVKKNNNSVLIDLGTTSHLRIGREFFVFKEGEVIKHPKTGEILDVEQIRTGRVKISQISANLATAKIIQEEPKQEIKYGQLVQSIGNNEAQSEKKPESAVVKKEAPVSKPTVPKKEEKKSIPPEEKPEPKVGKGEAPVKDLSPPVKEKSEPAVVKTEPPGAEPPIPKKEEEKPVPAKEKAGYIRSDFSPGERDNLASGGQGPAMLPLPTGAFMMGSDKFPEKPPHFVKIDRQVSLMVSEVTFEEYEKFCTETNTAVPDDSRWGKKDRPVINVSWHDAQAYASWLTKETGNIYRLPSEAEWEWAISTGNGTIYAWGNGFKPDLANCKTCSSQGASTQAVPTRSFPANKFGFHDMAGNVWEWVEDCWVDNYTNVSDDQSPRKFTGKCSNYTLRGGGWNSPERQISTTSRLGISADTKSNFIGFRLVKESNSLPAALPRESSSISITKTAAAPQVQKVMTTAAKKTEEIKKPPMAEEEQPRSKAGVEGSRKEKVEVQATPKTIEPIIDVSSLAKTLTDPVTGMEFVLLPGGCFKMGDTFGDGDPDEKPLHEVCVDSFYMGKYEVTQGQYQTVTGNNPSKFQKDDNYPVEKVSWNDVQNFIRLLTGKSGSKYRLPTEAEWEYAARSGGKSEKYAGGNEIDAVAWYNKNCGGGTNPVGQKQPNGLGLYDMSGNVREWCGDWYDSSYYGNSPRNSPKGSSSGSDYVVRGGSWGGSAGNARATSRFAGAPSFANVDLGFRLVLPIQRP